MILGLCGGAGVKKLSFGIGAVHGGADEEVEVLPDSAVLDPPLEQAASELMRHATPARRATPLVTIIPTVLPRTLGRNATREASRKSAA
jgi:hypothetical protein